MASSSSSPSFADSDPASRWLGLKDEELTTTSAKETLDAVSDDLWAVAACVDRVVEDVEVQRSVVEYGLGRTEGSVTRSKEAWVSLSGLSGERSRAEGEGEGETGSSTPEAADVNPRHVSLVSHFSKEPADARVCRMRSVLLDRLDRLNTFVEVCKVAVPALDKGDLNGVEDEERIDDDWEDDPWAEPADVEDDAEGSGGGLRAPKIQSRSVSGASASKTRKPPLPLSQFLLDDLLSVSRLLASQEQFGALQVLLRRHSTLWPYRFVILESIPEHADPEAYRELLPGCDPVTDTEQLSTFEPWKPELDWVETEDVKAALHGSEVSIDIDLPSLTTRVDDSPKHDEPLTATELAQWYKRRIDAIVSSTGMIDVALTLMQHGAAKGVPELDQLGEDLSLLSRLIYDSPRPTDEDMDVDEDWTLARWRLMSSEEVVRAYLAYSTPESVVRDIRRLVLPYLFVLESRAERAGQPDPSLVNRLLYNYLLSAPLRIAESIFDASKLTLPPAQRLVKSDEDMARLALACLYGNDSLDEWATMSRIFECLPAWDNTRQKPNEDEAATTIVALGAFVTPSTTRPRCTPKDLFTFFEPLPAPSLSRFLDILDIHLESGEILARWNVPVPLRWFLQSMNDRAEQRKWAERMARRAAGPREEMDELEEWVGLLEDMVRLAGTGEGGLKGAFGLVEKDEIRRIYFGGLLSAGKFNIAKSLLRSRRHQLSLDAQAIEDICLSCSREFYDNASSGNYKFGDMKLAYDCLDVPPPSEQIVKEKEFIEATSRLSSFNIMSRPGIPISPIEIRLTKDRLSLVSRVLSSNSDAYKHTEVILDLVYKLGFRGDVVAEAKTLAMLADTALQVEDFDRAYETSERMVDTVLKLRLSAPPDVQDPRSAEASEVCWVACFQLGRQPEFEDVDKKLRLLGRALELCPADRLHDVLNAWRRLESEDIDSRRDRLAAHRSGDGGPRKRTARTGKTPASLAERLQQIHVPSLTGSPLPISPNVAALASRTFQGVAANFPFGVRGRDGSRDSDREGSQGRRTPRLGPEDVSEQASRVFHKGIGWLIGADEE